MKKTAQQTTATSVRQKNVVSAAVKAVVGEEETFEDIGEHPYSLDLPIRKHDIAKLRAACERLFLKLDISTLE